MAVSARCLLEAKHAESAQTTQVTATTRTIIDKFTAYNGTAGAVTFSVAVVESGGAYGTSKVLVSKSMIAGETYTFPELVGHVLEAGDFISTLASAATSVVIRASGRQIS